MRVFHKYLCYRSKSVSDSLRIFTSVGLDFKNERKTMSSNANLLNLHFGIRLSQACNCMGFFMSLFAGSCYD